ncbi:uncharacterized protein LOC114410819 [Glycine soja]|uniref:uncharacterized protein LOC114410819 n=1 Tax=Glycine soja TaxID=3848 RepID=UPI00103C8AB8|nr:uncharacterized protein LOC114410819 [Glycine soja]
MSRYVSFPLTLAVELAGMGGSIMIRTRGLGRTLGKVIGRALGREVSGDADEAPLQRMLPASTHRQWEAVTVVEDVQHVDHADDEEHLELKLSSHGRKVEKFGRPAREIKGLVAATGLSPLIACAFHSFEPLYVDDVVFLLVEFFDAMGHMCDYPGSETYIGANVTQHSGLGSYAWRVVALAHMYDNLNDASKSTVQQLAGYITLLQHFPIVGSAIVAEDYDERKPCSYRWKSGKAFPVSTYRKRLNRLMSDVVCWILYGEHRAFREFETVFYMISHPFMSPAQPGDPPKHPLVQHHDTFVEPDVAQHPVAATAMDKAPEDAHADVDQPRHAVEACQAIVERLERLLNLRIVTEGTEAYTVTEDCLGIARVWVTALSDDDNV